MSINLGQSRNAVVETLQSSHTVRIRVEILDMEHDVLDDVSHLLLGGQVDVDGNSDITRSATLELLNKNGAINFVPDSPNETALFIDRMIAITYVVVPAGTTTRYEIPVFTGPVTKLSQNDSTVNIECQGKEMLAMSEVWSPMTFKKGTLKRTVIRSLLANRTGETKFHFSTSATSGARLKKDLTVGRESVPWEVAQKLAKSMHMQLFYDGAGVCRLRKVPKNPVFTFRHGNGGSVISEPSVSYTSEEITNLVWVVGGTPRKSKTNLQFWFAAPRASSSSPESIGRNGVPRYFIEKIEDSDVLSKARAKQLAEQVLDTRMTQTVDVSFDAFPMPFLEPGDVCRVYTDNCPKTNFKLQQFSIPLGVGDVMTVGYNRRLSVGRRNKNIRSGQIKTKARRPRKRKKNN